MLGSVVHTDTHMKIATPKEVSDVYQHTLPMLLLILFPIVACVDYCMPVILPTAYPVLCMICYFLYYLYSCRLLRHHTETVALLVALLQNVNSCVLYFGRMSNVLLFWAHEHTAERFPFTETM